MATGSVTRDERGASDTGREGEEEEEVEERDEGGRAGASRQLLLRDCPGIHSPHADVFFSL